MHIIYTHRPRCMCVRRVVAKCVLYLFFGGTISYFTLLRKCSRRASSRIAKSLSIRYTFSQSNMHLYTLIHIYIHFIWFYLLFSIFTKHGACLGFWMKQIMPKYCCMLYFSINIFIWYPTCLYSLGWI